MRHPRIILETCPPAQMRYETVGDWFVNEDGDWVIRSIHEITDDNGFLVALHELVEMMLCKKAGITQHQVDDFDLAYTGEYEPGDEPTAPYRAQHRQAMLIEYLMANFLGHDDYGRIE
jgi:hypothetical protein